MMQGIYDDLLKEAQYASDSYSQNLVYQTYGKAVMARKLKAIDEIQFQALNRALVRDCLNRPKWQRMCDAKHR